MRESTVPATSIRWNWALLQNWGIFGLSPCFCVFQILDHCDSWWQSNLIEGPFNSIISSAGSFDPYQRAFLPFFSKFLTNIENFSSVFNGKFNFFSEFLSTLACFWYCAIQFYLSNITDVHSREKKLGKLIANLCHLWKYVEMFSLWKKKCAKKVSLAYAATLISAVYSMHCVNPLKCASNKSDELVSCKP